MKIYFREFAVIFLRHYFSVAVRTLFTQVFALSEGKVHKVVLDFFLPFPMGYMSEYDNKHTR